MYCLNVQSKKAVCALKYYYIYRGKKLANISCGFDHCNSGSFMHPIFFLKFDRSISKKHEYFNNSVLVYISLPIKNIPLHSNKDLYQQKNIDGRQLEHFTSLLEDWECKFFSDLTFLPVQLHRYLLYKSYVFPQVIEIINFSCVCGFFSRLIDF